MNNNIEETKNWPDLAIALFDRLTSRNAEIAYDFQDLEVQVPDKAGEDAKHTKWTFSGTVKVKTSAE